MMLILDTNVLSAIMGREPEPAVVRFMTEQSAMQLHTTAISQAEILAGIAILPEGRRRGQLETAAQAMFQDDFAERVLPFDGPAATAYGELYALRRQAGRPASTMDLMIAAIARVHGAVVVTRDTGGFEGCGLTIIDPWRAFGEGQA